MFGFLLPLNESLAFDELLKALDQANAYVFEHLQKPHDQLFAIFDKHSLVLLQGFPCIYANLLKCLIFLLKLDQTDIIDLLFPRKKNKINNQHIFKLYLMDYFNFLYG